jgi:ABC-type multidrug transport system ATPase subunit
LDDVLSAVDAHTAHHLFHECLKGELMRGRTSILVSHHVQLCSSGASYIVALDNGHVMYEGDREGFVSTGVIKKLGQSQNEDLEEKQLLVEAEEAVLGRGNQSDSSSTVAAPSIAPKKEKKPPRKLVEEETRAVGRIQRDVWLTFLKACGSYWYWALLAVALGLASAAPVFENGWLKYVSFSSLCF